MNEKQKLRRKLQLRQRREVTRVNDKYRKLVNILDSRCEHKDWTKWSTIPNPDFQLNMFGDLRCHRYCKDCGKRQEGLNKI